jgi:hypothetical protein
MKLMLKPRNDRGVMSGTKGKSGGAREGSGRKSAGRVRVTYMILPEAEARLRRYSAAAGRPMGRVIEELIINEIA